MAEKETLEILLKLQDQLSREINKASKNITKMGVNVTKTSGKLINMSKSMERLGRSARLKFVAMGAAVVGVMAIFARYEKQMSKVKAISGATEKEFAQLKETARGLGATTKFSAKEAGEGMEYLALAGYNTNQTIAAMPGLLNLAAAGQLELGKASDLVTDILSQYGKKAEYATQASDLFAKVQATSNTNVELLGSALLTVGGTAKSAGMSLEQTAAIVGLLADQGMKGAEAGTSLNRMIIDMVKEAPKLKSLGVHVFDTAGEFRNWTDVIIDIENAMKGKNAQQRSALKLELTGIFGQKTLNKLLQAGSDRMRTFTKATENNTGTAARMAKEMEDNLIGQLTILKSSLQEVAIGIGERLVPAIRGFVKLVNNISDAFNNLSPGAKSFIGFLGLAITGVTGLIVVLGFLAGAFLKLRGIFLAMQVLMAANPFGLIVFGITAAITAIVLLYKNWNTVISFFKNTLSKIPNWFNSAKEKIIIILQKIILAFLDFFIKIPEWSIIMKNKLFEIIKKIPSFFSQIIKNIWNSFASIFNKIPNGFNIMKGKILQSALKFGEIFKKIGQIIFWGLTGQFGKIKTAMTSLAENIRETMNQGRENIKADQAQADINETENQAIKNRQQLTMQEEQDLLKAEQQALAQRAKEEQEKAAAIKAEQEGVAKFETAISLQRTNDGLRLEAEKKKLNSLKSMRGKAGIDQVLLEKRINLQLKKIDIANTNEIKIKNIKNAGEEKERKKKEREIEKQAYKTALKDGLDAITYFLGEGAKKYKAAAIALKIIRIGEATANAWAAGSNALATVPFPANLAAMGGIVAKGLATVASIVGIKFAEGTATVPGAGNTDTIPAALTPGEMIVPKSFAESIRAGELSLSGEEENAAGSNEIQININNPIFYGEPDIDFVKEVFRVAGEGIAENLITPLPEGA